MVDRRTPQLFQLWHSIRQLNTMMGSKISFGSDTLDTFQIYRHFCNKCGPKCKNLFSPKNAPDGHKRCKNFLKMRFSFSRSSSTTQFEARIYTHSLDYWIECLYENGVHGMSGEWLSDDQVDHPHCPNLTAANLKWLKKTHLPSCF